MAIKVLNAGFPAVIGLIARRIVDLCASPGVFRVQGVGIADLNRILESRWRARRPN